MRLTYKSNGEYLADSYIDEAMIAFIDKLGQLEDIEDELGIDLITLFKAYTNGFYVKGENDKQYIDFENSLNAIAFKNGEMFYGHKWSYQYVNLKDYGKTWALTKEELL